MEVAQKAAKVGVPVAVTAVAEVNAASIPAVPPETPDPLLPPMQVPLTEKQPVATLMPLVNVEVAEPETISCEVEAKPLTSRLPAKVEVAVVDVAVSQAKVGEVEEMNAPVSFTIKVPWPKAVWPVPPFRTESAVESESELAESEPVVSVPIFPVVL